jgi:hypothetical protein
MLVYHKVTYKMPQRNTENMLLVCCLVELKLVGMPSAAEIHTLGRASFPALFNCPRSSPTGATNWVMAPFTTLRSKTQPQLRGLCHTRLMVSMNIKDYPYIGLSTSET